MAAATRINASKVIDWTNINGRWRTPTAIIPRTTAAIEGKSLEPLNRHLWTNPAVNKHLRVVSGANCWQRTLYNSDNKNVTVMTTKKQLEHRRGWLLLQSIQGMPMSKCHNSNIAWTCSYLVAICCRKKGTTTTRRKKKIHTCCTGTRKDTDLRRSVFCNTNSDDA